MENIYIITLYIALLHLHYFGLIMPFIGNAGAGVSWEDIADALYRHMIVMWMWWCEPYCYIFIL